YVQSYFPLTSITTFTPQTPAPQFLYDTVQPDKLLYTTGETVTIDITGTPDGGGGATTVITGDFTAVGGGGAVAVTDTGTETWSVSQLISAGAGYDRTITFDAVHDPDGPGGTPAWPASIYDMDITVDDVPTDVPATLDPLTTPTAEASVLLDWTANPGSDVGSASMANPSGLGKYKLRRGTASGGPYDTTVADNIPITTTQFLDTFVVNLVTYYYVLDTYDAAGNYDTSGEVFTEIQLPFLPAQPDDLPATINPSGGIDISWTANPGDPGITGYRVLRSGALYLDDALAGTYTQVGSPTTSTSLNDPGPFTEAYHYCYKVESTFGGTAVSAPVYTRVDTVAPAPAELATPFDPYNSEGAEIVVSWAIETIPQYSSGGFPGQDLNGIAYWEIWRQENPPSTWVLIATVPYGPATEDQQVLDTAVTHTWTYEYSIRTFDAAGNWADNEYTKTTQLIVTGPGVAVVDAVTAGATEVTQGDLSVPITVDIRNPGINDVTLNGIQLYFYDDLIDVTSEYTGASVTGLSQVITQLGGTWSTTLYVDVGGSATLGTIDMWAETTYDTSYTSGGGADSWLVKPDADLNVQSVTSTTTIVYPGQEDIPVYVSIKNPGGTTATLESVALVFTRGVTDISDKFMVEYVTSVPTDLTDETRTIELKVTVSQGITTGAVTIDATCAGSAMGVPLSDTDGGISTWDWGVQTSPKPVIVSVVADAAVYWDGDTITLTVECDTGFHTVKADFTNVDTGDPGNETAPPPVGTTYTIQHLQITSATEGTYDVTVYAENATGTDTLIIPIRTGQAPTFSNWGQIPGVGSVTATDTVDVDIDIDDNSGQDPPNVQATLQYRVDGGAWNNIPMIYAGSGHWDATIPAQYDGATVEYHINATDLQGNWNVDSHSYTITPGGTEPEITGETTHEPGFPGNVYTDQMGEGAPFDAPVAYRIDIDTSNIPVAANYVVLVSAFEPTRSCYIAIDPTVWLDPVTNEVVTLQLQYNTGDFPSGTLITGKVFVLTDLPSNLGRTVAWMSFQHLVE
ncbi:MAG: hypothetical protein HWN65_23790, partial [Candidatus Helarchaeota archaeon]|nr:hypothetical protein [Candidatus Helarchaeota archaeon]